MRRHAVVHYRSPCTTSPASALATRNSVTATAFQISFANLLLKHKLHALHQACRRRVTTPGLGKRLLAGLEDLCRRGLFCWRRLCKIADFRIGSARGSRKPSGFDCRQPDARGRTQRHQSSTRAATAGEGEDRGELKQHDDERGHSWTAMRRRLWPARQPMHQTEAHPSGDWAN